MTKRTSVILLSLITVVVLFFGVFAFIPDGLEFGDYNVFYSPYKLIQRSGMFTDTVNATYYTKLDEGAEISNVQKIINSRLEQIYGYYSVDINVKDDVTTIAVPKTVESGDSSEKPTATTILNNVTRKGNVELLSTAYSQNATYDSDSVVLKAEHFRKARTQSYIQSGNTFYICEVKLTSEGTKIADKVLNAGTQYLYAIDETLVGTAVYTNSTLQLYSQSKENSKVVASYIKTGVLGAELTLNDTTETENGLGWIFSVVMGVIVLASFIFFAVRYKTLGLAGVLSQLIAIVIFMYFAGLVFIPMFNIFAAIGVALAYLFMTFFTVFTFEKIRKYSESKTFNASMYKGFADTLKVNLIAHAAFLVLGIVLWVIPTAVTAPLGCVMVYGAVLSFAATFGLNRLFSLMVAPFNESTAKVSAKK